MKKTFCCFLAFLLCLPLMGCQAPDSGTVPFFYSRSPELYQYFENDGVIQFENRDLTGHSNDLRYMVGLYLAGPLEEGLTLPFTKSTRLQSVEKEGNSIVIRLSDHAELMTASEFSLACACLALTCMNDTGCEEVTVISGERSLVMNADNILLYDSLPQQETTGG